MHTRVNISLFVGFKGQYKTYVTPITPITHNHQVKLFKVKPQVGQSIDPHRGFR